ncbi:hypothetical protein [Sphingomonas aerolata]|uniref:hypothetical protein n=1 Tax=Sphingomonas aerolata TaxID=185951 RepID=UPI002FE26CF3
MADVISAHLLVELPEDRLDQRYWVLRLRMSPFSMMVERSAHASVATAMPDRLYSNTHIEVASPSSKVRQGLTRWR